MQSYPTEWLYPDESNPNPTQTQPHGLKSYPDPTQIQLKSNPNPTVEGGAEIPRVVFSSSDLAKVAKVGDAALRKSWLPYLEEVAPRQIILGHGQYSRKAMELIVSLRHARDEGMMPRAWVVQQMREQSLDADEAIAQATANGAIVPVEVLAAVESGANQLAIAQSQSHLARSLVDAVLTGIHGQQQAYSAQTQALDIERIRTQAAIKYAVELQVEAQVRAEMDAQLAMQKERAIAQQLQQFQGGQNA
jgi:hypothetical protein